MARLIDADELIYGLKIEFGQFAMKYILAFIKAQPTVDPVKHGWWIIKGNGNAECSCCGYRVSRLYEDDHADFYCRHCGARMDGDESESD